MYDRHLHGKLSEYFVAYELTRIGLDVTIPSGNPRYDLIVESETARYFVQVKSTYRKEDEIKVNLRGNSDTKAYTKRDVDIIAIHDRSNNEVYYLPIEELRGQVSICLKYEQQKKIVSHRTRMAADYKQFPNGGEIAS